MGQIDRGHGVVSLKATAYAKVNLGLEVVGQRADGLHDIVSVMQTVDLADKLYLSWGQDVSLECDMEEIATSDNLVLRALRALAEATGRNLPINVRVYKGIPVGAGLGGGSSDAAAVLAGATRLSGLRLHRDMLSKLAFRLGADVAFFLRGGTCLVTGAGEKITRLRPIRPCLMVLVVPPIVTGNKTRTLYSLLGAQHYTCGEATIALARAIDNGEHLPEELMTNTFESIAFSHFHNLSTYWERAVSVAGRPAHLSGSGPAFFFVLEDWSEARALSKQLRSFGLQAYIVRPTRRGHVLRVSAGMA